jgi:hypothetical protein
MQATAAINESGDSLSCLRFVFAGLGKPARGGE